MNFPSGKYILFSGSQKFQNFPNFPNLPQQDDLLRIAYTSIQPRFFQNTTNDRSIAVTEVSWKLNIKKQEEEDGVFISLQNNFQVLSFFLQRMFHIQEHSVQQSIQDGVLVQLQDYIEQMQQYYTPTLPDILFGTCYKNKMS